MTSAYIQPSWDAILIGPTSHRRRVSRGWTAGGVILMVVGALLLSSPLLAMLAITYDPGTRVAASDGEDTAMLARDRKSTRLNCSHKHRSRMPSSA